MGAVLETTKRNRFIGMYSFLVQRLTGVLLVLYLIPHILVISSFRLGGYDGFNETVAAVQWPAHAGMTASPIMLIAPLFDIGLLALILFHALNGIRIIAVDIGRGSRVEKPWFYVMMAVAAIVLAVAAWAILQHTMLAH